MHRIRGLQVQTERRPKGRRSKSFRTVEHEMKGGPGAGSHSRLPPGVRALENAGAPVRASSPGCSPANVPRAHSSTTGSAGPTAPVSGMSSVTVPPTIMSLAWIQPGLCSRRISTRAPSSHSRTRPISRHSLGTILVRAGGSGSAVCRPVHSQRSTDVSKGCGQVLAAMQTEDAAVQHRDRLRRRALGSCCCGKAY